MSGSNFVKARQGSRHSVIYTDAAGNESVYSGGDWAWRNNNPGNLRPGKISKRNGAIGKAGGFAVFSDRNAGHRALLDCLQTTYANKNLFDLAHGYAPGSENDTAAYHRFLIKKTAVRGDRKVRDFTASEFEKLWRAIEQMEGGHPGKIEQLKPTNPSEGKKQITEVRKNKKGTIVAYNVEGIGWVTKGRGISLASRGEIDAVVAASRSGNLYLRTRPGIEIVNLEDLG